MLESAISSLTMELSLAIGRYGAAFSMTYRSASLTHNAPVSCLVLESACASHFYSLNNGIHTVHRTREYFLYGNATHELAYPYESSAK